MRLLEGVRVVALSIMIYYPKFCFMLHVSKRKAISFFGDFCVQQPSAAEYLCAIV